MKTEISMGILGIYIFNSTRNEWLQDDLKSWGPFSGAFEWSESGEEAAESTREYLEGDDVTFTMAALH
jgi:hypothetical protein